MRNARCTLDDKVYNGPEFGGHDDAWREGRKGTLQCVECNGRAWYIDRSRSGHSSGFGAHHERDCTQKSRFHETQEGEGVAAVPAIDNMGGVLDLRMDGLTPRAAGPYRRAVDETPDPDGVLRHVAGAEGGEDTPRNQASMGLGRLLGLLINDPQYAQSDERMRVPDRGEVPLKDLVKAFRDITGDDLDRTHVVWGAVTSVQERNGWTYINTGPARENPCPVVLSAQRTTEALGALGWENFNDLWPGGHAIVFGKIQPMRGNRSCIAPENIGRIALRPAP